MEREKIILGGIDGSLPSPVVGKSEKNIGCFCRRSRNGAQGKDNEEGEYSIAHRPKGMNGQFRLKLSLAAQFSLKNFRLRRARGV